MESTDLTVEILQQIRDEIRASNTIHAREFGLMRERFEAVDKRFEAVDKRFEAIEITLRDLSEQMVMHSRALRSLLDHAQAKDPRYATGVWADTIEARLDRLEQKPIS